MENSYVLFVAMLIMLCVCLLVLLSVFSVERDDVESHVGSGHDLAFGIGKAIVELSPALAYRELKDELHPRAVDYYERSQGHNVTVVDIPEKPKLKVVK
ncbi:hypothetical protein [Pseudoalteromonas aurantia]|uniref:Uncharacterized protein n=1 Tax=Pseudoalteromonas aurantia 208 TaxID=1314867 RepID=A0ABR9EE26_9GAMM|nr:hypothetical protein [Pseudoalteromonas aurantia]MBE0369240.1 hypothetical protein [Pseudoalteromonas aurantia 208]